MHILMLGQNNPHFIVVFQPIMEQVCIMVCNCFQVAEQRFCANYDSITLRDYTLLPLAYRIDWQTAQRGISVLHINIDDLSIGRGDL